MLRKDLLLKTYARLKWKSFFDPALAGEKKIATKSGTNAQKRTSVHVPKNQKIYLLLNR
jgi:hypothetical protein